MGHTVFQINEVDDTVSQNALCSSFWQVRLVLIIFTSLNHCKCPLGYLEDTVEII